MNIVLVTRVFHASCLSAVMAVHEVILEFLVADPSRWRAVRKDVYHIGAIGTNPSTYLNTMISQGLCVLFV
jgi:hypothetical protein